jgi:hypothetical protein
VRAADVWMLLWSDEHLGALVVPAIS